MERIVTEDGVCETAVFDSGSKSSIGLKSDNFVSAIGKKETDKCRHFSIRAYVAEVREKDWKICWPFSSFGDNEESKKESEIFAPLHVPEFRWWGCQNCLQRSDASDDAATIRLVSNSSASNICGLRNSDVNTSVDIVDSGLCLLTQDHVKEKVADVISIIRQDLLSSENYSNIVVKDVHKTTKDPISAEMKAAQFVNGEFCKGAETINLNLENGGLVELVYANCGSSAVNIGMLKCANNSFTEVFQKEKGIVSIVAKTCEQVEDMKCQQKPELGTLENEVLGSRIGFHTSKCNPLELTENDDDKDAHRFSSPILSSRRPQKFRLLTEILRRNVSGGSAKIPSFNGKTCFRDVITKVTQTNAADERDGLGLDIPSRGQIAVEENVENNNTGRNKKRKALQIEDQEQRVTQTKATYEHDGLCLDITSRGQISAEENVEKNTGGRNKKRKALQIEDQEHRMRWSKSESTDVRIYNSDKETTRTNSANSDSKSVNEAIVWEGLHSDFKSQYSENKSEIKVIKGKKKNKTTRLSNDGSTGRGLHPSLNFNLAGLGVDLTPGDFNDKATYRKDVVSDLKTSTKTDIVSAKPSKETTSKRGLHSFVNYCMASVETNEESALKNQKHEVHQIGKTSVMTHNRAMPKEDQVMSKERGYATKVASGTGSHSGLKIKKASPGKAISSIEQDKTSQLQDGASTIWSKDLAFINGYKNKMDALGLSEATEDQSNGRANKTNEMESLNDIPVEIVELLAKNRHERRCLEAGNTKENKLCMSKNTKNATNSEKSEFSVFLDNEISRYPLVQDLKMLKPLSNAVGSISAAGRSVAGEPAEESIAYSSRHKQTCKSNGSKIKQLEESHDPKGAFALSFSPANHSSRNQFSKAGSSKNLGVQSCRWDGDKLVPGWPNSSFQCLTSCHERRIASSPTQIRGSHHVSLLNVPGCPFGFERSQKSANLSQRPNRNFRAETFKKINAEQPCACTQKKNGKIPNPDGHLMLCSNETIPATQLLKLMDAGMSSKVSRNVDDNMVFTSQPSFPQITHCKGIFPPNGGLLGHSSGDYGVGKSSSYFPSVPMSDAVAFPGQRDKSHVRRSLIANNMVNDRVKSGERKSRKISDSSTPTQAADCKQHGFGDGSRRLGQKPKSFPINGVKAEFHPPLISMVVPLKSNLIEGSIGNIGVDNKVGTVGLLKGSCGTDICTLNRNPADFSIPEEGNEFMIGGGDFKLRKTGSKRGRPRLRMMKLIALKECAQI